MSTVTTKTVNVMLGMLLAAGMVQAANNATGSLPQCRTKLATCTTNLTSAQTRLNTCNANLTTTQGQLSQCQTSLAAAQSCGNGVVDAGEQCDGAALNGASCSTATAGAQPYGTLSCVSCQLVATACTAQRFVDNNDGTVTDHQTGLQWEKKTATGCPNTDVHCVNNHYTWSTSGGTKLDGTAFTDFLGTLNNCQSSDGSTVTGGFAGHCDWRLPTIAELRSIVDTAHSPTLNPTFGPTQQASFYWSSTSFAIGPSGAWFVNFSGGGVNIDDKSFSNSVRAVRGGL